MHSLNDITELDFTDTVMTRRYDPTKSLTRCAECGGEIATERWETSAVPYRDVPIYDHQARILEGVPLWAAVYALEGMQCVTRYACRDCGETAAVLAKDLD